MDYEFLDKSIEQDNIILPNSDKINPFLLRNNHAEVVKAVDFIHSKEKFLYVHGFMGTGKRQFINYLCEFLNNDVIKLEYYCKQATVCDDILLDFGEKIDKNSISKAINLNAKITTLGVKFQQQITSIKKPFLIILHSFDDILDENLNLVAEYFANIAKEENVKIIVSTRALKPNVLGELNEDRKVFLKAFSQDIFKEFLEFNKIECTDKSIEDFYKQTRGYYYYVALAIKIINSMQISLSDFIAKYKQSGMSFDSFLGHTYINLVPTAIRNFFWFLRTVRHGLSLNALAVLELYDEFSVEYLKTNLMIFQADEIVYVQDFFLQKIDISIPDKTQIRLHKYIIGIYEGQLRENLKNRSIMISRQALRAEIEYHNHCIENIKQGKSDSQEEKEPIQEIVEEKKPETSEKPISVQLKTASDLAGDKKYTEAIEAYARILELENIDLTTLVDVRLNLARLYKEVANYSSAMHYYELVEAYYKSHKEFINLNYLYYETADLYYKVYKFERAIETIKQVIYSVDTPQSLMVSACTMLGNFYSDSNNFNEAYSYYKKALDSLDENVDEQTLAELYFKFALVNDDKDEQNVAFEYYNKCIAVGGNNSYKALAYSNLASCYYENENFDEARNCFSKAYELEKQNNNYDGIYYTSSHLAKIYVKKDSARALDFLLEAKRSAEFINEGFYILESHIALGDYYYNIPAKNKECLIEYLKALALVENINSTIDISVIERRIQDMKLRMKDEDFAEIEKKYGK